MSNLKPQHAETSPADLIGSGGELHQVSGGSHPQMTTNQGVVIADDENSLRANPRGPTLLEDVSLLEKLQHFNHERIPERVVHARGAAAHGYFELTDSLAEFSKAKVLTEVGVRTPLFTRFSTVAGNAGSADTARDVRGFAVKLYTSEGNWDLVGNNIPVFFIQDAIKFPDLIHAAKQEPDRGFPQAQTAHDTFWDWASLTPESTHMLMWIMSDRTIPRSFRMMEGFGVHSFRLINHAGASTYVKFHWRPALGSQAVVWDEALKISGGDPDFHRRDLWDSIEQGAFPKWELGVQLFDEAFADSFDFDILDSTKLIPEELVPLRVIGHMVLDRNPDNYFSETEQVAFCTTHVIPGIDFTNDPLLQGRNQSYLDTQLSRLGGPNFAQLPINAPRCPMRNFQRDGHMQMGTPKGRVSYSPSSLSPTTERQDPVNGFVSFPAQESGDKMRVRSETFADHYSQARQFFFSQTEPEQNHIVSAFIFELSKVETEAVRTMMLSRLVNVDEMLAKRIAEGLGHDAPLVAAPTKFAARTDLATSPMLSMLAKFKPTLEGRKVGCLVADGTDAVQVTALEAAAKAVGANFAVIAPKVGGAKSSDGGKIRADFQLAGGPSVLFDTVVLALSKEGAAMLAREAAAVAFVHDAFAHLKVIGHTDGAKYLMEKAGVVPDAGVVRLAKPEAFLAAASKGRIWDREPSVRSVF
ncbi:catalase (plasmid) [Lichenicola cladoniae]|uniref:Catalase n=1 Tax=Lichenicola cladoniae TaxID=1484109 RepID=A0A6M8HWA5_9PROT|nr:catalase [Lichenicola cladoniae]NPD68990.1 catalase [Acetobacteraceae bacterium]QKE92889.1 catalase [Lichenicola cladoniae]